MTVDALQTDAAPLAKLHYEIVGQTKTGNQTVSLDDIEQRVAGWKSSFEPDGFETAHLQPDHQPNRIIGTFGHVSSDGMLGVGHLISRLARGRLYQTIAPKLQTLGAGTARALGGIVSAGFTLLHTAHAVKEDLAAGRTTFPAARREMTVGLSGITAGAIAGEAGFLVTGAAIGLGAPTVVSVTLAAGSVIGVGCAVSWTRKAIGHLYDQVAQKEPKGY